MTLLSINSHLVIFRCETQLIYLRDRTLLADNVKLRRNAMQHFSEHEIQSHLIPP